MTTDFLVTTKNSKEVKKLARTLKYKDELMDKRVLEKFEIDMAQKLDVNQQLNVKYVRRDFSKKVEAI